jgi:hypothetical protein
VGEDGVERDRPAVMGSEDFAYMLAERPGAYIVTATGWRKAAAARTVHNPRYDFNDAAIPYGAGVLAAVGGARAAARRRSAARAMTVIVATGMRAKARCCRPACAPWSAAATPRNCGGMLDEAAEGATAVLSFGIAGGLDTGLECGALVVATRVRAPGGAWPADATWSSALVRASGARLGVVAGPTRSSPGRTRNAPSA